MFRIKIRKSNKLTSRDYSRSFKLKGAINFVFRALIGAKASGRKFLDGVSLPREAIAWRNQIKKKN